MRQLFTYQAVEGAIRGLFEDMGDQPFTAIIAPAAGGLIPAAMFNYLRVKKGLSKLPVYNPICEGYDGEKRLDTLRVTWPGVAPFPTEQKLLFLDDIIDTGRTAQYFAKEFPGITIAALVAKEGADGPIHHFRTALPDDVWAVFPWENGCIKGEE